MKNDSPSPVLRQKMIVIALIVAVALALYSAVFIGDVFLWMVLGALVAVFAIIYPRAWQVPGPVSSSVVITLMGWGALVALGQENWAVGIMLVIGFGLIVAFVAQMLRPAPRSHLVSSVAMTLLGGLLSIGIGCWRFLRLGVFFFGFLTLFAVVLAWAAVEVVNLLYPSKINLWARAGANLLIAALAGALGVLVGGSLLLDNVDGDFLRSAVVVGIPMGLSAAVVNPLVRLGFELPDFTGPTPEPDEAAPSEKTAAPSSSPETDPDTPPVSTLEKAAATSTRLILPLISMSLLGMVWFAVHIWETSLTLVY